MSIANAGEKAGTASTGSRWRQRMQWVLTGLALVLLFGLVFLPKVSFLAFAGLVVVAAVMISRRDEVTAITVLLGTTFLIPANRTIGVLGQVGIPAILVAGVLLLFWVYSRCAPTMGADRGRQPIRLLALILLVSTLASYIAGHVRGLAPLEVSSADAALLRLCSALGLLLFTADTIRDTEGVRRVIERVVMGASFMAVVAMLQYYNVVDLAARANFPGFVVDKDTAAFLVERFGLNRVSGTATHPIEFGVVLGMVLPLALHLALTAPRERRLLRWVMTGLIAGVIPLSISRSGILTAAVALLCYLVILRLRTLLGLMPLAVIGVLGITVASPGVLGTIKGLFLSIGKESSSQARTVDYPVVYAQWIEHPVLGRGPGTYIPALYRILDNQYLLTLVSTGTLGLVVLLGLFCTGYSLARHVRWYSSDESTRGLGQALAGAIAGAAVASFTYDAFSFTVMFIMTHLLVGCAGALWRTAVRGCVPSQPGCG
ncbi:MAG TPA: O-antigen ligase family protein [Pseudonocardiaceae bacterium]|jgi:hypothetical protein|nr:O-antigen ligase family protein [Pseudonocardiaceae bacterium]